MIHHLRHRGTRSRVSSGSRADIRCAYGAKSVPREIEQSAWRRPTTQTADPSSGSECGDVSTFRKAQRYSLTSPIHAIASQFGNSTNVLAHIGTNIPAS